MDQTNAVIISATISATGTVLTGVIAAVIARGRKGPVEAGMATPANPTYIPSTNGTRARAKPSGRISRAIGWILLGLFIPIGYFFILASVMPYETDTGIRIIFLLFGAVLLVIAYWARKGLERNLV
jgi:hypothetical protein